MPRNTGTKPGAASGKRVRVLTYGGYDSHEREPQGWPADAADWAVSSPPKPYQIKAYQVIE